jgi:hypothetical protein
MVLASCGNKYYRTNFIYAVPSSLLIAPGLRTIQFLFSTVRHRRSIASGATPLGKSVEEVIRKLTKKAARFVDYTCSMGFSMNASKTQMLLSANAGNVADISMMVDRNSISPSNSIELLGVRYDRKLSMAPHVRSLLAAVRQRASVVARLANHLPRGQYLRQLAYGLIVGKFSHALAMVARLRLPNPENESTTWSKIQVAFNNAARSITGVRLRDRVPNPDLLNLAGIPSVNRMVVKVVYMEAWMGKSSSDGKVGVRNYVGAILFDNNKSKTGTKTHSAKTGKISIPLRALELSGVALGPTGRGWHSDQRGCISFGLEKGCAHCTTTSRRSKCGSGRDGEVNQLCGTHGCGTGKAQRKKTEHYCERSRRASKSRRSWFHKEGIRH